MKNKPSMFNVYEKKQTGEVLVYNMLTQSAVVLEEPLYREFLNGKVTINQENEILKKGKFVVSSKCDEKDYLMEYFKKANATKDSIGITVCTTTDCNMKCSYCYEEGIQANTLKEPILSEIVLWLKNFCKNKSIKNINLLLFGGEPLVAMDETIHLMKTINEFAKENNINVNYLLATNGVLLNKENVIHLRAHGLKSAQVTIDGPKRVQDERRPMKSCESGYELIVENINNVVDLIAITVKINIDKGNFNQVIELLDIFEEMGIRNKIQIKFEAIAATPISSGIEAHHCSQLVFNSRGSDLAIAYHKIIDLAELRGFKIDKSTAHSTPCMYTSESGLVIDSKGDIYKCISAIGVGAFCVGSVKEEEFNENYKSAIGYIDKSQKCLEKGCAYAPKCGAGCAYDSYCRTGAIHGIDCKKEFLKEYYSIKFNKISQKIGSLI